ncbi:hypothetical protein MK489_06850 [Myxococcota bacterium]|nr:hypothetical protein [Myxococcota bacterium]
MMIPDTQNYLDYKHQKSEGYAFDANTLFVEQMQWVSENSPANGGDIAFVAHVGDVWQHQSIGIDPAHLARGIMPLKDSEVFAHFAPTTKVYEIEIPKALEGYRLIDQVGIPFGTAPGNHHYDALWSVTIPQRDPERQYREVPYGFQIHVS